MNNYENDMNTKSFINHQCLYCPGRNICICIDIIYLILKQYFKDLIICFNLKNFNCTKFIFVFISIIFSTTITTTNNTADRDPIFK